MRPEFMAAGMALLPGIALWLSYPRRPWASAAGVGAALAAGAAAVALAPSGLHAAAVLSAAGGAFGAALGWALCRRRDADHAGALARLEHVRARRAAMGKELAILKARGLSAEQVHKETMATYGMVKGLAEALSWEDARPRIEAAIEQYFGVNAEYALYVSGLRGDADVRPLALRGLRASPGATWATLGRLMQEQGAAPQTPKIFERPERAVGMPIREGQELLGYLYARVPENVSPQTWLAKTQSFCSELIVAFKRVKLFQEVERLSEIDGLTGVRRRGAFDKRIAEEAVRAKTFKTTFGLMLLDIDHFKSLNDRYGHPFGDQVLKRLGAVLNASVYETDYVARYGGEEFVILLPRAEPAGALRKAEAIRAVVEAESFTVGFETVKVTVSIGLAHFPRDAATPEDLVARADAAMYGAKSGGRNRVVDSEAMRRP
ncbi:MAG: GGDEF domain-containing protein [Elusimicrobiota bacterium]